MRRPDRTFRKIAAREKNWAWIGWLLSPFSLIWGIVSAARRKLYTAGTLKSMKLPVPIISIGNIEIGGVGKTPVTIWLADRLSGLGIKVAVVARNLDAGRGKPMAIRPGMSSGMNLSDEVLLLRTRLGSKCAVYAGSSKAAAAERAVSETDPDVIIVDDGFQHLKLQRDIDIVVLDHQHPLGLGGVLPAGTLREIPAMLSNADYLWVNRSAEDTSRSFTKRKIAEYNWQAPFIFSRMVPSRPRNHSGEYPDENETDIVAFCGIAKPLDFKKTLEETGYRVLELVSFPDHYRYTEDDLKALYDLLKKHDAKYLMTTEKDAVKISVGWSTRFQIFMLPVDLRVEGEIDRLLGDIVDRLKGKKTGNHE